MTEHAIWSIVALVLLIVLPIGAALMLRWARCIGWPIVGGVSAGILLGPGVLGRIEPDVHQKLFEGGAAQRQAVRELISRHGAEEQIELHLGLQTDSLNALHQRQLSERITAQKSLDDARWTDQRPLRGFAVAVVALTLLASGAMSMRRREQRQGIIAPLSIGAWAAVLPGALAYVAAMLWWSVTSAQAMIIAAAVAIGPWTLTAIDRQAANDAEFGGARMVQTAGRIASLFAMIAAAYGFIAVPGWSGVWPLAALTAFPIGWLIAELGAGESNDRASSEADAIPGPHSLISHACAFALLPMLAASASIKIDLLRDFAIWPFVVVILLSGDGRWIGAIIGALLPGGRTPLRTMRLVLGSMAAGPTQLAVVALAAHLWAIPSAMIFPLVAGALYLELTTPSRRLFSQSLIESEHDLGHTA